MSLLLRRLTTPVSSSVGMPIEATGQVKQTAVLPLESVQPVDPQTSRFPLEAPRGIVQTSDSLGPFPGAVGYAGAAVNEVLGGNAWVNPGNVVGPPDGAVASLTLPSGNLSDYLFASTYGFAVPSAVIGVEVVLRGFTADVAPNLAMDVILMNAASPGSAIGSKNSVAVSGGGPTDLTFGGITDRWNNPDIIPAKINGAAFGVKIDLVNGDGSSHAFSVDAVQVTIYLLQGSIDVEALGGVAATRADPVESVAQASQTLTLPLEAVQAILATGSSDPVESARGVTFTASDPVEATGGVAASGLLPIDETQALATTASAPTEAGQGVQASQSGPLEAGQGITATVALVLEAVGGVARTAAAWVESLQGLASSAVDAVESALGLSTSASEPIEATQGVTVSAAAPVEAVGGVASSEVGPVEATQGVSSSASDPIESLGVTTTPVSQTVDLVIESTQGVAATGSEPLDATGTATSALGLPLESIQPVPPTTAGGPIEALQGTGAATVDAPIDVLGALLSGGVLPIEALGFVPIPPPAPDDSGPGGIIGDMGGPEHSRPLRKGDRRLDDDEELVNVLRLLDLL